MPKEDITKLRDIKISKLLNMMDGRRLHIKCPFHKEKSPSCMIYPDNSFHCFGCGKHGKGAIDFVMALGCGFKEACEELKNFN